MTILYLLSLFASLEQHYPIGFLVLDLLCKATVILLFAGLLAFIMRHKSAADKSVMWMVTTGSLLLLPLFHQLVPGLTVAFSMQETIFRASDEGMYLLRSVSSDYAGFLMTLGNYLVTLYLLVSGLMLLYLGSGVLQIVHWTRRAQPLESGRILSLLQKLRAVNGITAKVTLRSSSHCISPLTWGMHKHWIILPEAFSNWDDLRIEQTLSHELAHIQRNDWSCFILSRLVLCLYWINPLVWIAHSNLVIESEKACDDLAIDDTGCTISYAENLLLLATTLRQVPGLTAPALLGRKSALDQRIRHILAERSRCIHSDRSCLLSALLITALLIAPFSAIKFNIRIIEDTHHPRVAIPVKFIPRDSAEYPHFMREFGVI